MFKRAFTFRNLFAPSIYCLMVVAAAVAMFAEPQSNALGLVGVIFLTLPWSLIFFALVHSCAPAHFFDSTVCGTIIICFSAAINIVLLFFIGASE